jgi:uncharacterized protein YndB with AHSA1/START domain
MDNLERLILTTEPGKQEVVITQFFEARRELVFQAHTDPRLIPQWWGPARFTTTIEQLDLRPGGLWRFVQRDAEGNVYGFHGVYHEVAIPDRLVYTFEFEGTPGHVLLETARFEEQDGKTRLVQQSVFQSVEDRDEMLQAGMVAGAAEGRQRLVELLARFR